MNYNFDEMIERIKVKKKEIGLTNKELSELSNVPYGTLNKILGSETKEPSINAIIKISLALGVSANYIINGENTENIQTQKNPPPENKWEILKKHLETLSDKELIELEEFVQFLAWKKQQKSRQNGQE